MYTYKVMLKPNNKQETRIRHTANKCIECHGENFQEKIVSALKESRLFLLILTQESADSKWVKLEVTQALKLNMKIYTLQIKETELDDLWTFKLDCSQITNGIENFEAALESIAISIKKERDRRVIECFYGLCLIVREGLSIVF